MVLMLLVVMVVAAAVVLMLLVVMVVVLMLFLHSGQLRSQSGLAFHGGSQLFAGKLTPGSSDDSGLAVMLSQQFHCGIQLCLRYGIGTGQDDGGCGFNLVVVELTEVLHIDLHLAAVHNGHSVTQRNIISGNLFHSTNNIGQLAYTGGFDDNTVGVVLFNNLCQSLAEIPHQRTADTARIHLGNINACILQEATVNADFTKLIFNQHQFLAPVAFLDHLLDKGCLTGAQKTGININFHKKHLLYSFFLPYSIPPRIGKGKGFFSFSSTRFDCL